jgi:hypothetical protein
MVSDAGRRVDGAVGASQGNEHPTRRVARATALAPVRGLLPACCAWMG